MSDAESLALRLEDGEIDESNEPPLSPEAMARKGIVKDLRVVVKDFIKTKNQEKPPESAVFENPNNNQEKPRESSEGFFAEKGYFNDKEVVYIDEDEMLCVRGASPVPFVVERLSYSRKSPFQDCDTIAFDITPPKRRKTSGKRRRKRTTPRKVVVDADMLSDEETELEKLIDRSESPQEVQNKLPQLCKFYLQDCCAKKSRCEYMHSEFPCKFFYLGLKCEDESSETGCKLLHGASLSTEMLSALDRHINTAPIDVLGPQFVELRSKMEVSEISQMLQKTQDSLRALENVSNNTTQSNVDCSDLYRTLKEKLYFLNDDQLNSLKQLKITKVDDLLNLTLGQLNAVGIHATQIDAIQMSFVTGQDTDIRNMLPVPLDLQIKPQLEVPSFEVVCLNDSNLCDQNWYEREEVPLVIDEDKTAELEENEDKASDSGSDTSSNITKEGGEKVEAEIASVIGDHNLDQPAVKAEILHENTSAKECSKNVIDINQNEQVIIKKFEESSEKDIQNLNTKENNQFLEKIRESNKYEQLSEKIIHCTENIKKFSETVKNIKKPVELSNLQTCEKSNEQVQTQKYANKVQTNEIIKTATERDFPIVGSVKENIGTFNEKKQQTNTHSFGKEDKPLNFPIQVIKSENSSSEIKTSPIPISENLFAEIDVSVTTTPTSIYKEQHHHEYKSNENRGYINPFQKKITTSVDEIPQRYSSMKKQRKNNAFSRSKSNNNNMKGGSSSEDWDADEKSDLENNSKEIASPDQSEDECTPFVADGFCPDMPQRTRNLDNYQPAFEINAHLTYPPMEYKLHEIYMPQYEINKPTLMEKLLKSNSTDPRLKKFIEKEKNHGIFPQAEYSFFPPSISQCDPRLRQGSTTNSQEQNQNVSRVLYSYLQGSQWYQELKSNLKIQINHSVSDLVRALNYFHSDPSPQKIFDLFQIECAGVLLEVMRNVGIFIDVNGNITEEANYKQLCTPLQTQQPQNQPQQQQQPQPPFSGSFQGTSSKPGLLGFAPPGVPHPLHNSSMNSENSFARQAFGRDCLCNNNSKDMQSIGSTFYVGGRYEPQMNRNPSSGFEPPYQRQNQKRNFKRR